MLAEWLGGLVLIAVLSLVVKATVPAALVDEARHHEERGGGHEHMGMTVEGGSWRERLASPDTSVRVPQNFAMDWSMLWKDLAAGFLFADLIVLPLIDIYRRYYGWRMALYMSAVFYAVMAIAGLIVDLGFTALGIVPRPTGGIEARVSQFEINYTFWLNLAALVLAIWLFILNRRHPMDHGHGGVGERLTSSRVTTLANERLQARPTHLPRSAERRQQHTKRG